MNDSGIHPVVTSASTSLRNGYSLALGMVLVAAAVFRFIGLNWDENQHLHPDERFLTMVETSIRPPASLGEYFHTDASPLNPHNAGHGFFVYGTFPIFLVRFLGEYLGRTGYDEIHLVGRAAAATFDLVSVVLLFLIGARLYDRRVGLAAAALAACTPLLIQHAHFFVVDSFTLTFVLAAFYFAVRAGDESRWANEILFGLAVGLAMASKISAFVVAGLLPLAGLARIGRLEPASREAAVTRMFLGWLVAAAVAFVTFRLFQPYAFAGPGLLGLAPNPKWVANLTELANQSRGNVDFPPALQWADRTPVLFALKNLVIWGMGPALGVTAWLGWGWALVRLVKGQQRRHLLPVVWTGVHFLWQSTTFTPSMRYQLPVVPTLALLAAWAILHAWQRARSLTGRERGLAQWTVAAAAAVCFGGTVAWAAAFTSIYTRPVTRVAASRWIYRHLPGPVNIVVDAQGGSVLDPVPMPFELGLGMGETVRVSFASSYAGEARAILLPLLIDLSPELGPSRVHVAVRRTSPDPLFLAEGAGEVGLGTAQETSLEIPLSPAAQVSPGETIEVEFSLEGGGAVQIRGDAQMILSEIGEDHYQPVDLPEAGTAFSSADPILASADGHFGGLATGVSLPYVRSLSAFPAPSRITASLYGDLASPPVATGSVDVLLSSGSDTAVGIPFTDPVAWEAGRTLTLKVEVIAGPPLVTRGSVIVSESSWDDGLPLGVDGQSPGGRYQGVVQELYWPDNQDNDLDGVSDKLERIVDTLAEGDLLAITSNRQFGTIPRVPIRYPLSTAYYRELLNCPPDQDVAECADRALPGMVSGALGYELTAVFRSDPRLGPWSISDQSAEEVFTVYDHPLVLLFRKRADFSATRVRDVLEQVDLSRVVPVLPKEAGSAPPDLMLPEARLQAQQAGGTWSDLFRRDSWLAQSEIVTAGVWWLAIFLIGLAAWPLTRAAFPGLRDGGYPLARLVGLLVIAWGWWMLGSLRLAAHRPAILIALAGLAAASAGLAWRDRHGLADFWRSHRREIVMTEVLALSFFLLDLGIRLGNPDLWHPSKGGEKPMDLAYLNAVLRSESFPPYDPWFAGGYINYYYFGFVLVGAPIQLLGIVPTVAYNLVIPTLFSLLALGAYCAARNVASAGGAISDRGSRTAGVAAAIGLVVLGNLGTARMLYEGWKRIGLAPGEEPANFLLGVIQSARGLLQFLTLRTPMPYGADSWYWDPSRALPPGPGEVGPITEFPFFTFLYADLHAHMIALPLTVLALCWGISWLVAAHDGKRIGAARAALALAVGGLIFGALRPTNTWDFPVYLGLGAAAASAAPLLRRTGFSSAALLRGLAAAAVLVAASVVLYLPYAYWYGQGYTAADLWQGSRTDLGSYLVVHGLFIFVLVSWMAWEVRQWMAATPLSSLDRLRPWANTIALTAVAWGIALLVLVVQGFSLAWLALPMVTVAGLLILRPTQPIGKRIALALAATAVALTFVVDVVVLRGDISRMNTVFKFYLQVWTMFSLSAAAAVVWLFEALPDWRAGWRRGWIGLFSLLLFYAALYPMIAAPTKMRDRMDASAPHSLDGMAFMEQAVYYDQGSSFPLAEDARAIRWLQEQVRGTPVIVEAHVPEYRWGARMAIYTGLPTVLGWKHHQSQQRIVSGDPTAVRAIEVSSFYLTTSTEEARSFLERYGVEYVIVGRLERMYYDTLEPCVASLATAQVMCDLSGRLFGVPPVYLHPGRCSPLDPNASEVRFRCSSGGMEKFDRLAAEGFLRQAYRDGETVIYQVVAP